MGVLADWYGVRDLRAIGRTPWVIAAGMTLMGLSRGIVMPFLVLYLVQTRGLDPALVGFGILLEFVVRAFAGPLSGALSDRMGRKPLMMVGLLATGLILPTYLFVRTPTQYLALSVANGALAAYSLYGPAASALIADTVPSGQRGSVWGVIHAARNFGWTLGIASGVALLGLGFVAVFVVGGILPLAYLVLLAMLVREPARKAPPRRNPFASWPDLARDRRFVAYLGLIIIFYVGWGHFSNVLPLFITQGVGLPPRAVALIGVNSALIFLLAVPFGRLADRRSRSGLLAWSATALAGTFALYVWTPLVGPAAIPTLVAALMLCTLAELLFSPILDAFAADLAPRGTTGSAMGILALAQAVGLGLPLVLVDLIVPTWGWTTYWALLVVAAVASSRGLLALGRKAGAAIDRPVR